MIGRLLLVLAIGGALIGSAVGMARPPIGGSFQVDEPHETAEVLVIEWPGGQRAIALRHVPQRARLVRRVKVRLR